MYVRKCTRVRYRQIKHTPSSTALFEHAAARLHAIKLMPGKAAVKKHEIAEVRLH